MAKRGWMIGGVATLLVVGGGALAVGDYVYRTGTAVPCEVNEDDRDNTLASFHTPGPDNGPFPGDGWNKWVGHDLSDWWLPDASVETVTIPVADGVTLEGWWVTTEESGEATVIVTHGYGTSKRDYNALLPTSMLVGDGFRVLLLDQRNTGGSTCVDGRHSAGQNESDDFAAAASWLVDTYDVNPEKLGMFGVSGGGIGTAILPAKTDLVQAFAIESAIFDFQETAIREVEFQGFPGFLWRLAEAAALLRGVNLQEVSISEGIDQAGDRPLLLLHGTEDQRLAYEGSLQFVDYAESVGANVRLETFEGADHTEGMLTETERYRDLLVGFFRDALGQ